jgi:N-acetyl-anhydromuramyl-L-alanine amidase AmpD
MFSTKTVTVWILLFFTIYSCTPTKPSTTNVLAKQPAQQNTATKTSGKHPGQTVFVKPEQITKQRNQPENPAPQKTNPVPVYTPPTTERPAYGTRELYKFLTDSIQQVSAKPSFRRTLDSLVNMMSFTKNPKNPAVNAPEWDPTVNFNMRKPNFVILHHTAQNSLEQTLYTFSIARTAVSSHYVIGRDGTVHQMLNDYLRAWHAGASKWGAITDMNSCSLGIEIDNDGTEPFSDAQINSLIKLLTFLKNEYGIPQANFIGHSDIAPERKNDPSKYFPWKKLAEAGFGFWYDSSHLVEPPENFNALLALRVIGYNIQNQKAAIVSFKLHYIQTDTSPVLSDYDKKVLYNVYLNY